VRHIPTASQTVGPFFNFGLTANPKLGIVAGPDIPGERIRLTFRVIDGDGAPAPGDAMIEIWQADAAGRYTDPLDAAGPFHGFGRLETDFDGRCTFETIRPGSVAAPGGLQAPHFNVLVFARGLLRHLHTRVYFEGDPANDADPVLGLIPEGRRATLLARRTGSGLTDWLFDIVLQGESETVFFDV
jgi:protocatechuate 3,4-dioxygenase alpha subunit